MRVIHLYLGPTVAVSGCVHVVTHGDVEQLAASGPYNDSRLATEICGKPADLLASQDARNPLTGFPRAELLSWSPTSDTIAKAPPPLTSSGQASKRNGPAKST